MKKLNKFFAVLVALAMMATLCVSMAFAEDEEPAADPTPAVTGEVGTEANPATAALTKVLKVPTGTSVNETYAFKFEQQGTTPAVKPLDNLSVTFDSGDTATSAGGWDTYLETASFPKATEEWTKVGVYEYKVTEVPTNPLVDETTNADGSKITKTTKNDTEDASFYTVKFGIAEKADGTKYVQSIGVYDKTGKKVTASDTDSGNDFKFVNEMSKKITNVDPEGKTPDTDDSDKTALAIEKLVVDKSDATKELTDNTQAFSFRLNVTAPVNAKEPQTYGVEIVKANGETVKTDSVTTGTNYDFQLKTGERLVFTDIDVGASYTVKEADYAQYTKAYSKEGIDTTAAYVTDGKDYVKVTNTYDKDNDPATGLSIANLPFIVLALVAIGGLVAYVVVRRKSEDNA